MHEPSSDVYATARGPLARFVSPLAGRARARRHARFFALARLEPGARVLDVGCGQIGLRATEPELEITGLDRFVQKRVDGITLRDEHIAGKPAPDSYLRGAQLLDVAPDAAAVFEDALSGVQAGRAGHFGFVVGVDQDPDAVQLASYRTSAGNVEFRAGDIATLEGIEDGFDAVVGRLVLMYLPDPAAALRSAAIQVSSRVSSRS